MRRTSLLVLATVVGLAGALLAVVPVAGGTPAPPAEPANVWQQRHPLNIAHAGGDLEAPHETMYAYKRAVAVGADALEMDIRLSADGEVMVVHDDTIDRTTNGTGAVRDFTAAQLQAFDNAYWFAPGCWSCHDRPVDQYALRGVRTGEVPPPTGYVAGDFTIPTLRQVLEAFPDRLLDIEIKDGPDAIAAADGLAALIDEYHAADRVVVVSFDDSVMDHFHTIAPGIDTSPGLDTITAWFGTRGPLPGETSLQVPPVYSGIPIVSEQFVADAHANNLAVYVWFNGDSDDTTASYESLLDMGVDGFITGKPALLQETLDARGSFVTPFEAGPRVDWLGPWYGRVDLTCPQRTASHCAGSVYVVGWKHGQTYPTLLADVVTVDAARGGSARVMLRPTAAGRHWARVHRHDPALVVVAPSNPDTGFSLTTIPASRR